MTHDIDKISQFTSKSCDKIVLCHMKAISQQYVACAFVHMLHNIFIVTLTVYTHLKC